MSTRILAIDTATEACSVAVWNQGEIHALFELCPREHTQRILPMVQQVLAESGLALNQLDALAFGRGPGSFTGVRIGIGIAQGLALGADLPMIGVSTLQTMAQGAWRVSGAARVLAAIDARMGKSTGAVRTPGGRQLVGKRRRSRAVAGAGAGACAAPAGRMGPRRHRLANLSRPGQRFNLERTRRPNAVAAGARHAAAGAARLATGVGGGGGKRRAHLSAQ